MKNTAFFKGKKVTVIGLARSGVAASVLLRDLGAFVSVTDAGGSDAVKKCVQELSAKGIKDIETGKHTEAFIKGRDMVVVSPGVSDASLAIAFARKHGIPLMSEIELSSMVCPAAIVATTGTNGKTTVTTLIGKVIEASGKICVTCGNIGNSFSGEVKNLKEEDFVSLEVSSFQLEKIKTFKPRVSVILNLTPDHLDRYSGMDEYLEAKKRIYMNQDAHDFVVLNYEDPALRMLEKEIKAQVRFFKPEQGLNPNQSAVLQVALALGIDKKICLDVLRNFKGMKHRLESVLEHNGVEFVNDSKATNVDSTMWALRTVTKPVILIAGGRDKGIDYSLIGGLAKDRVKAMILIGEAADKIRSALGALVPHEDAATMAEAVRAAFTRAKPGDCVLLSPMCASFDMFKNYEHRGEVFKEAVNSLVKVPTHA